MHNDIQQLRKQAENAVSDMPEGELKVKAFEVAFRFLLERENDHKLPRLAQDQDFPRKADVPEQNAIPRSVSERILSLQSAGFFGTQRALGEIQSELRRHGWHYAMTALSGPLQSLVQKRLLRREQISDGNRKIWKYANY